MKKFIFLTALLFLWSCSAPTPPSAKAPEPSVSKDAPKIRNNSQIVIVRIDGDKAEKFNDENNLEIEIEALQKLKNFLSVAVFKKFVRSPAFEQIKEFRENAPNVSSIIYQTRILDGKDDGGLNYFVLKDALNLKPPSGRILGGSLALLPPDNILSVTRIGFSDVVLTGGRIINYPFFILYKGRFFPSIVFKAVMEYKKIAGGDITVLEEKIKIKDAQINLLDYFSFQIDYNIDLDKKADIISLDEFLNEDFTHQTASGKIFIFGDYSPSAARFSEGSRELTGTDINAYAIVTLLKNL